MEFKLHNEKVNDIMTNDNHNNNDNNDKEHVYDNYIKILIKN